MWTLRCGWCNILSCHHRALTPFLLIFVFYGIALWFKSPSGNEIVKRSPTAIDVEVFYSVVGDHNFSEAICSPQIFQDYYARVDYFPGDGRWITESGDDSTATSGNSVARKFVNKSSRRLDRYVPKICKFRYGGRRNPLPLEAVLQCFRAKNISSLATMGDSNGGRHFLALERLLSRNLSRWCAKGAKEKVGSGPKHRMRSDIQYYSRHDSQLLPLMQASNRLCWTCVSRTVRCQFDDNDNERRKPDDVDGENMSFGQNDVDSRRSELMNGTVIELEHLMLVRVLDNSVTLKNKAATYQEFLLKYYLKGRYPDLLIIFPPFNHEKYAHTLKSTETRLRKFADLLSQYLPPTTRVIWIPAFGEFESTKPRGWSYRRFEGLLATKKIDQLNHKLYGIIRSKLIEGANHNVGDNRKSNAGNVMGFFDQVRVSSTRLDISQDGVHMAEDWYTEMISYILQMFCGDIFAASDNEQRKKR